GSLVGRQACFYDYIHDTEIFTESKRFSLLSSGQYALNEDTTLFAEELHSDTKTNYRISHLTLSDLNYPLPSEGGIYY
ncbi:hypothetical protein, partial [Undibacterium sp. 5I1]|uniref:hypothetical protein n=1 Tax=Undibacterium sp. 5I1 TaxID=3048590 RepID=UPI002B235DEF